MSDISWIRHRTEGQFFEQKSCFDRSTGDMKRRKPSDVARDIAETLAAMANADGGTLVLGIEDDGKPTGYEYPYGTQHNSPSSTTSRASSCHRRMVAARRREALGSLLSCIIAFPRAINTSK